VCGCSVPVMLTPTVTELLRGLEAKDLTMGKHKKDPLAQGSKLVSASTAQEVGDNFTYIFP